jgi:hypothetical protein
MAAAGISAANNPDPRQYRHARNTASNTGSAGGKISTLPTGLWLRLLAPAGEEPKKIGRQSFKMCGK